MGKQETLPLKLEPRREGLGRASDLGTERLLRHVAPCRDLMDVRARPFGAAPGVDPAQLMLGALRIVLSLVLEFEQECQLRAQAEFLVQAASDGVVHLLAPAWMRAAGVRPVARPESFAHRTLLYEQFTRRVEHDHREGAVQRSTATMHSRLCHDAELPVIGVDQNQLLVVAGDNSIMGFQVWQAAPPSWERTKPARQATPEASARMGQMNASSAIGEGTSP